MTFPSLLAAADRTAIPLLGGPVRYETSAGEVISLNGIFEATYARADADQIGVVSTGPALFVLLADLVNAAGQPINPDLDPDPTITIDGTAYSVREVHRDGIGGVIFFLHEAG